MMPNTEADKGPHGALVLSTHISGKVAAMGELGTMLSEGGNVCNLYDGHCGFLPIQHDTAAGTSRWKSTGTLA